MVYAKIDQNLKKGKTEEEVLKDAKDADEEIYKMAVKYFRTSRK